MSSNQPLNLEPAPPRTSLTAQRSRSQRIQYAGCFVVFLLVAAYAVDSTLQRYTENPTNDNLIIAVIMIFSFFTVVIMLAYFLVPKVEFFEDHLVARSLWGVSRKRRYQEISELAVKRQHLFITFTDRSKIALHPEEINREVLARWLADHDVTAARDVRRKPRRTSKVWGAKPKAFSPASLQNKAATGPLETVKQPLWMRLVSGACCGWMLQRSVKAVYRVVDEYFETLDIVLIFWAAFPTLFIGVCIVVLAAFLIPKVNFYEDHMVIRSMWGRLQKRSYQEITEVAESEKDVFIRFNDGERLSYSSSDIDTAGLARFLVDRGVSAARDVKWKHSLI